MRHVIPLLRFQIRLNILTDKIFVKQSIVSSDDVNYKDIQCPECHDNQFIILSGYLMIPREEIFEKGKLTKQQESTDISFDVKQIHCLKCQTKSIITEANIFALEKTNLFLNEEVRKLTGKDPLSLGPIN
jgi:hypothetical protein